ncbi:MAG TPA: hypothetical protein VGS57_03595 [Thermoanaerobaculia bacterium]|nr:hypothetical protein [Thermoanaerobaculia bacterium]
MGAIPRFFALPLSDLLRGQQRVLRRRRDLAWLLGGLLVGWWVYVPVHELLHAFGCVAAGGAVSRLEIDGIYGGALLARVFPWVVAGSEYAGRLSGFDTRGSDAIYLVTDLLPFVLTLPGVWALRRAARAGRPGLFGAAAPFALAPLLSLTGDAYEIGSMLVTRLAPWAPVTALLRGDDVSVVFSRLAPAAAPPWGGFALAIAAGVLWAWATYGLASLFARALGEHAIVPSAAGEPAGGAIATSGAGIT